MGDGRSCVTKKQYNMRETDRVLNSAAPASVTYNVCQVSNEAGEIIGYSKLLKPADLTAPPIWSCGHEHPTWNEAAECQTTPETGGEPLQL